MERSFGIIPLRRIKNKWKALLVKHRKGHWAFPKGHSEPNELPQDTAYRELEEETGLRVAEFLSLGPLEEVYIFKREGALIEKKVTYFVAEVEGTVDIQVEEIEDFRWVALEEAAKLATFFESKALCFKAAHMLRGR